VRRVGGDRAATVADQISLLLDATGSRAMLRESKAETTGDKLENIQVKVRLEENFRSTGHILSAANSVIVQDRGRARQNALRPQAKSPANPISYLHSSHWGP
jgi:hypothetical protein